MLLAQRDLADAQANATLQTSKQSAANTALAAAMDRLSPAGQKFVSFLTNVLQPAWLRVQKATQEALLPPVQRGLAALLPLLGVLQTGLVGTANVLGRAFEQLATAYLATPVFRRDLASIMTANTRAFATLGTALVPLTRATIDLIVASEPLLQRFADFIAYSATLLGNWIALQRSTGALGRFFQVAGDTAAQLWRIIRDLGVAIYNIGKAAFPAGQLLLSSFEGVVAKFRDWTASMQGQNTLRDYFDKAVPTVQALGRLLDGVVRAFFRLGKNTDFAGLLDMIRTQALPAIERLAATLNGAFGPALVKAVTDVINLFADLAGAGGGGALTAFVETLDRVVLAFDAIARNPVGGVILRIAASAAGMAAAFSLLGGPLIRIGVLLARVGGFAVGFFQVARGAEAATSGITKIGGVIATKLIPWVTRLGVLFLASGPWGWIILGIAAVVTGLILAYQHFEGFRNLVNNVLRTVGAAALWFYRNAILPAFNGVKVAIAAVGAAALWLWHNAIVPAFNAIGTLVTWWWRNVVQPPLAALVNFFRQVIAPVVSWLWASIFRPIFGFIGTLISVWWRGVQLEFKAFVWFLQRVIGPVITWLWRNVVVPVFAGIGGTIKATVAFVTGIINTLNAFLRNVVGPTFSWLWRTIIVPAWNGIGSIVRGVWVNFISPAFEAIKTGLTKVKDAFGTAVKLISALWNGLKNVVAVPVRFVLDTIYNNGIRGIWNKVAGLVHLPTLPEVKIKGINAARGAVVPGYAPGVDIVNAVLSPGEGILVPEAVRGIARMMGTTAEQAIQWLNSMFSPRVSRPPASRQRRRGAPGQAGMLPPHFGIGGVFSWVGEQIGKGASAATSFVGSSISSVLGALKDLVAGALSGPLHAAAAPLHALINKVLPATPAFVNLLRAMANQGLDKAIDFVVGQDKKVTPSSAGLAVPVGSVGAGVERWRGLVSQALAIIGQPQALANTVLYRMNIESGGNPNAINLTDSNAQHGDPSRGLMQTIMSTFMAYHYPGTSFNIYDPMANVLASMRYALARYGSLAAAYLRKGGYALGGVLPGLSQALGAGAPKAFDVGGLLQPGWTVAQNTSGQPEMVFTAPQWDTLSRIVASAAGNTARPDGVAGSSSQTNITIPVQAARGMDTRQLAREVAVELAWQMRG